MTDYQPISCAFYDELEAAAVKHTLNTITYVHEDATITIEARIIDFKSINKEEFMVLENNHLIRLDKIITFNNLNPQHYQYC